MAYRSSPNSYFKKLPNLNYPSLQNDRKSAYDYQIVKNLFKRAVMRDDVYGSLVNFENTQCKVMKGPIKLHMIFMAILL